MENETKDGWKTSEFWMTIATAIFGALVMANVMSQDEAAEWMAILAPVLLAVVPIVAYTISRAKVKSG